MPIGGSVELDDLEDLLDATRRDLCRERERAQVVSACTPRVEVVRFENSTDATCGCIELAITSPEDERLSFSRFREAEQQPKGGRLPCTVRTQEPGDGAGLERKVMSSTATEPP